jgi:hypothetical protein
MNAKADSIEIVQAMILVARIQGVDEAVASAALARADRSKDAGPSAEPRFWLALRSAEHRAGEYWETLSYVAIWLCGLVGVGLCFL